MFNRLKMIKVKGVSTTTGIAPAPVKGEFTTEPIVKTFAVTEPGAIGSNGEDEHALIRESVR